MKVHLTEWADTDRSAGQKVTDAWETAFQAGGKVVVERAEEIHETARITEAQKKHEAELLRLENVVGVAASLKVTAGKPTKKWALAVLVEQKLPKSDLSAESVVPSEVDGVLSDVVEVGRIEPLLFNARVRPALPGYSIGHHNISPPPAGPHHAGLLGSGSTLPTSTTSTGTPSTLLGKRSLLSKSARGIFRCT